MENWGYIWKIANIYGKLRIYMENWGYIWKIYQPSYNTLKKYVVDCIS